ncbi:MAG: hypothetical protein WC305_07920 [Bacteroidales bacterium]|jgi:tetratricopeptide (TPR) repeat protein
MKKIVIILVALIIAVPSFSQGKYGKDSSECIKYLSYYQEYMKQNNISEAIPFWRKAISLCPPTANQKMLLDGQKIFRYLIVKNQKNVVLRQELLDSLIMLHDVRAEYYPNNKIITLDNKAKDIINFNYSGDNLKKQYDILTEILKVTNGSSSPIVFVKQMQLAVDLYKQGILVADDVINTYTQTLDCLEGIIAEGENDKLASVKKDVETLFVESGVASCEKLVSLYTPRYDEIQKDKNLLSSMVKMLSTSNCLDTDLFYHAIESLNKMEPTYSTAYYLYRLCSSREENEEAIKALREAITLIEPVDAKQASDYYLEMGTYYFKKMGRSASAIEAAKKSAELNEANSGKAYLLIGTIWGSQKCSGNEVEVRAPYWVAVDYMIKARNADPSLTEETNNLCAQYRKYFPQQADAFMYDIIDGASYTVSCSGMRENTIVRTQK